MSTRRAATPEPLDVDLLKLAMAFHETRDHDGDQCCDFGCARSIAAHYDRLAAEDPREVGA